MRTIKGASRAAGSGLVLVSLILGQLPATGQTRRAGARQRPAAPAPPAQNAQPPRQQKNGAPAASVVAEQELVQSPKSRVMAEAFGSGKLPEPARLPAGDTDEQAAALAKAVSAGDSSSTAALYAAVLAAGYGVREKDGGVLQTTERGQGLAFEAWEVAAMAKLYGEGYRVGLAHLGEAFTRNVPELKGVPLAAILLEGVRTGAKSDRPALRFWGRFVVELGRRSAEPYDLLAQVDLARVRLNAIQVSFILSRFAGDLALLERPAQARLARPSDGLRAGDGQERAALFRHARPGGEGGRVRFVNTGMRGGAPAAPQSPCGATDVQGVILDYNALLSTNLYSKLPGAVNMGKANLVLTVLKFIMSYAMLNTSIRIAINPMTRTKTTQPGEFNGLAGHVWVDNKFQDLNCLRPFFNAYGLDFNLPNSGPLADVDVVWEGVLGFDKESRGWMGAAQDFIRSLEGRPTTDEKIVMFMPEGERTKPTNSKGVSSIGLAGAPQPKDLSREKLKKVNKVAGVRLGIQFKSLKIKDAAGALSTAGDVLGNVVAFLTGDPVGGALGTTFEVLYRTSWYRSEPFYFLVYDWEPCEDWQGTISVKREFSETKDLTRGDIPETSETKNEFEATYDLTSAKDTSEGFRNGYFADALTRIEESLTQVYKNPYEGGFCDTGRRDARGSKITVAVRGTSTHTNRLEKVGAGTGKATVYIAPRGAAGYNILVKPPPPITGVYRRNVQFQFPQCPLWEKVRSRDREEKPQTFHLPPLEFIATFNENGALKGSKTVQLPEGKGGTITYKWDLQKCK